MISGGDKEGEVDERDLGLPKSLLVRQDPRGERNWCGMNELAFRGARAPLTAASAPRVPSTQGLVRGSFQLGYLFAHALYQASA